MKSAKFISALVAGSIALTAGFTTSASAANNNDKLAKIVLGVAAVAIAANVIRNKKKSRAPVTQYDTYRTPQPVYNDYRPKTCLRKKYTPNGWQTYYSRRCLAQYRERTNDHYTNARRYGHKRHDKHDRQYDHDRYENDHHRNGRYVRNDFEEFKRRANDKK
jgi:hypothetical protein